jgi:hypothetical protein
MAGQHRLLYFFAFFPEEFIKLMSLLPEKQIYVSAGVIWAHVYTQFSKHEIQLNMIHNFGFYFTETPSVSVQISTTCCVG